MPGKADYLFLISLFVNLHAGGRSYSFASAQTYAYAYARAHGENKRGRVTAGHVARSVAFPEIAGGCLLGKKAHDSARELSGPDAQLRAL